ncbi:hypothetical protein PIB30_095238 [Stylosanthes scabra]|uniref:Uncharacterized protein n=1 Tax=Stylosanthes scabra TaxID=79078 RepID=A0ABU6QWA3_9FABA|nr:hypothetical protein [Stylosanthes scabra]
MDQGTILPEFQIEIEEIKIAALESEKAIEKENSRRELNSNFQDQIVCAEIEACLEGDDVQMTNIFNGDTNMHDDVKNVSDIELLEKSNDYEVKNNVVVEVEELRSMKSSKFSVDLNENFDSYMRIKFGIVERLAFISIGGGSKMNLSTSRHNKDLNV